MRYIYNDNNFIKINYLSKKIFKINKKLLNYSIDNKTLFYVLGLKENKQKTIIKFMKKFINSNSFHVAYGTEAGIIQSYGLSTVIFGPGSIKQAHKPNEYISLDQLDRFDKILSRIH